MGVALGQGKWGRLCSLQCRVECMGGKRVILIKGRTKKEKEEGVGAPSSLTKEKEKKGDSEKEGTLGKKVIFQKEGHLRKGVHI
jgi:hypothetical protein